MIFPSLFNGPQQETIDCLIEENRLLIELQKGKRPKLNDANGIPFHSIFSRKAFCILSLA